MKVDENGNPITEEGNQNNGADNTDVETDAFGADLKPQANPNKDTKVDEGEGDKKFPTIPEDHPTIVALNKQIEEVKSNYGGNLSAQRKIIDGLKSKIDALSKNNGGYGGDSKTDEDVPFKDIKWSKDLSEDEKDDMTDTEIRQMDEIARMQEFQNKTYLDGKTKEKSSNEKKIEDLNITIQSIAKELSTGEDGKENTELTNQIIESFKGLNFNTEGLSAEDIKKKVEIAAGQVSIYTPPKEQINKKGSPIKKNKGSAEDPFGNDKIIAEATENSEGSYEL